MAILGELNEEEGLLYFIDNNGREELIKSLESTTRVYIRYTNTTSRPVKIWWRDFTGQRRFYARLKPTEFCDINTYVTHPWEFTDEETGERFNVGQQVIFRAPYSENFARVRRNWNISVSMRSLRHIALLEIALAVPNREQVASLGLPRELEMDVEKLVQVIQASKLRPREQ